MRFWGRKIAVSDKPGTGCNSDKPGTGCKKRAGKTCPPGSMLPAVTNVFGPEPKPARLNRLYIAGNPQPALHRIGIKNQRRPKHISGRGKPLSPAVHTPNQTGQFVHLGQRIHFSHPRFTRRTRDGRAFSNFTPYQWLSSPMVFFMLSSVKSAAQQAAS